MDYKKKAIDCVKDTVLPIQRAQFEECGCSYEIGYPKCVCDEVLSGKVTDVSHCECSRNSVLYILQDLMPDKDIQVEIIHTVLGGADDCRFKVTVS